MPSGPKKRRAQKKKNEAAASEKTENEATLTASSKEHSPVMQTGSTDGVTVVFDEPAAAVFPKRIVLLKNMVASSAVSPDVAEVEPLETSLVDKINVVGESSVVAAPCVVELDLEDNDGGSMMSPDTSDFEANKAEGGIEIPMPAEIYSSVLVSEPCVTGPTKETDAIATDATKLLQDDNGGSILASDEDTFSVIMDNIAALTIEPCDLDLGSVDWLNAENAVLTDVNAAEDQRSLEHKDYNTVEKNQDLFTPKNSVAVENQDTAALDEGDATEKTEAVEVDEVEAAGKNKGATILEDVINNEKNTLEAVALRDKFETLANNLEAVAASNLEAVDSKPGVDVINQKHVEVSKELVTPEVEKQLKELKEMVEVVLNCVNAIDALLHGN